MTDSSGAAAVKPWGPGLLLGGRYQLVELLGAGAMGEVWRAEHLAIGAQVAVKLVDTERCASPEETLARFRREARAAAALKTQHVVAVHDQGTEGRIGFIVMELLDGESVEQRLARTGPQPPHECARIMSEACVALGLAHGLGILHRDLKPANMFLARVDGRDLVKLLDFGLAKLVLGSQSFATCTNTAFGTPAYMSPEQVTGTNGVDHRADLWSMAIIAFEILTGRVPFAGDTMRDLLMRIVAAPIPVPSSLAPVPSGFDVWFARAAAREPAERFQSAAELSTALNAALLGSSAVVAVGTGAHGLAVTEFDPSSSGITTASGAWAAQSSPAAFALASGATTASGAIAATPHATAAAAKQSGALAWEAAPPKGGRLRVALLGVGAAAFLALAGAATWAVVAAKPPSSSHGAAAPADPTASPAATSEADAPAAATAAGSSAGAESTAPPASPVDGATPAQAPGSGSASAPAASALATGTATVTPPRPPPVRPPTGNDEAAKRREREKALGL